MKPTCVKIVTKKDPDTYVSVFRVGKVEAQPQTLVTSGSAEQRKTGREFVKTSDPVADHPWDIASQLT